MVDEPFVNYQERMTRAMKELTRKGQDMVSKTHTRGICQFIFNVSRAVGEDAPPLSSAFITNSWKSSCLAGDYD